MGGSDGKRQRIRSNGPNGQFDSIGTADQQSQNSALVVRLMGEIGQDGKQSLPPMDRIFLTDCQIKLNSNGSKVAFGWKQVEKVVALHKLVMEGRR